MTVPNLERNIPNFLFWVVYDRNHYFGLGPIPEPKLKLANTFFFYYTCYHFGFGKKKVSAPMPKLDLCFGSKIPKSGFSRTLFVGFKEF